MSRTAEVTQTKNGQSKFTIYDDHNRKKVATAGESFHNLSHSYDMADTILKVTVMQSAINTFEMIRIALREERYADALSFLDSTETNFRENLDKVVVLPLTAPKTKKTNPPKKK